MLGTFFSNSECRVFHDHLQSNALLAGTARGPIHLFFPSSSHEIKNLAKVIFSYGLRAPRS